MSEIRIQLDPVALREATTQAIMGILTPEMRADIISNAIKALLTPSNNSWDRNKTPLEHAFNEAVTQVARECATQIVASDPSIKERVAALSRAASEKLLNQDQDKLAERMADAFVSSIRSER